MRNKRGFTLIELVITMFILSVVLGLVTGIITNSMKFFRDEKTQVDNQVSLRLIAVDFEKDVRRYVLSEGEFSYSGGCYTINSVDGDLIDYCLAGNNLTRNDILIGERVSEFTAVYTVSNHSILLTIRSLPDAYNRVNEVVVRIYVRRGS